MKESKIQAVLEIVARNNHTSAESVKKEIECSIAEAIDTARKVNDQKRLTYWDPIPCREEVPSAEELIAYLSQVLLQ